MMNGIDVNVIQMPLEITLIADRMLLESHLPDALLALCAPTLVSSGSVIGLGVRARVRFFDQAHQRDNIAIELKWMSLVDFVEAFHKKRDGLSVSEQRAMILGDQREEENAAAHPCPPVAHLTLPILLGLARARPNLLLLLQLLSLSYDSGVVVDMAALPLSANRDNSLQRNNFAL
jgi:hypothetical protein